MYYPTPTTEAVVLDSGIVPLQYSGRPPHPHPITDLVDNVLQTAAQQGTINANPTTPTSSPAIEPINSEQQPAALALPENGGKKARTSSFLTSAFKTASAIKAAAGRKLDEAKSHTHAALKHITRAKEVEAFQKQFPTIVRGGAGLVASHKCKVLSNGVPIPGTLYISTHAFCFVSDGGEDVVTSQPAGSTTYQDPNIPNVGGSQQQQTPTKFLHDSVPLEQIAAVIPSVALSTAANVDQDYTSFPTLQADAQPSDAPTPNLLNVSGVELNVSSKSANDHDSDHEHSSVASPLIAAAPGAPPTVFGPLYIMPVPTAGVKPNAVAIYTWGQTSANPHAQGTPQIFQFVEFADSFVQELLVTKAAETTEQPQQPVSNSSGAGAAFIAAAQNRTTNHENEKTTTQVLQKLKNPCVRALYALDRCWHRRLLVPSVAQSVKELRGDASTYPPH